MSNDPAVKLTVALNSNCLNEGTVKWPNAAKPSKFIVIFNSEKKTHTILGHFYKVICLPSTLRPMKCNDEKKTLSLNLQFRQLNTLHF